MNRDRGAFLTRAPLFAGLDDAAIDEVVTCLQVRRYAAGQMICREGDPSDSLFLLRHGMAQAFVTSVAASSPTAVARLRPGDVIGEVGVITNLPRSASVIARSDATVLELTRDAFARLLTRHRQLLTNLTHVIGTRLARRNADLRGDRPSEVVALVVGARLAGAAAAVVAAARLASPRPVAIVDLLWANDDAAALDESDLGEVDAPGSVSEALEGLDERSATDGMVVIAVAHDAEILAQLLEHADRVVAMVSPDEAVRLAATLQATAHDAELILCDDATAATDTLPAVYRLVRRCPMNPLATEVSWLGRHLSRTKLGLALGAGGAKSFAHAGVIEVLERAGYSIDYVAGSSMGAVVAVWLALGMTGAEIGATLQEQCAREPVVDAVFRRGAAGDGIQVFTRIFRDTTFDRVFADLSMPATVMAVDLAQRCPAPIRSGPLWQALMAALAIPGLYPPWTRGAQRLVDAVSLVPVPLDSVIEAGADITIAVNLLGRETLPQWPEDGDTVPTLHPGSGRARDTVVEVLELAQLDASARQTARADVPVTPRFGPGTWRQMHLGRLFLAAGHDAAAGQLTTLERLARPTRGSVA